MAKQFEIYVAGGRIEITATTSEAKAYVCGMIEAFRLMGRKESAQLYDVYSGGKVFETQC